MRTSSEESDIEYELCRSVSNKQPTPHSIADILGLGFRISCETRDDSLLRPLLRQVRRVQKSEMADCVTERDMDMMANDEPLDLSVHKSRCRGSEDEHVSDSPKVKRRTIVDSHASYQAPQLNGQSDQSLQMAANFSTVLQYYLTAARLWQSEVIQCNESRSASSVEMTASDENALMAEATRPESSGPPAATKSSKRRKKELDSAVTDGASRPRKTRTTFTGKQLFELEKIFEQKKYLSSNERQEVARLLNVTGSQIKIWFQNRRTKWKKQDPATSAAELAHLKSASRATKSGKPVLDRSQQDAAAISASENSDAATNVSTPPASPSPE